MAHPTMELINVAIYRNMTHYVTYVRIVHRKGLYEESFAE